MTAPPENRLYIFESKKNYYLLGSVEEVFNATTVLSISFGPTSKWKASLVSYCSDDLSSSTNSSALHCLKPSLTTLLVGGMCLICLLIWDVSSWIVAPSLASLRPPSLWLVFSLRLLELGWNPPCKVRSFHLGSVSLPLVLLLFLWGI